MIPLSEKERLVHCLVAKFYESVEVSLEAVAKQDFERGAVRLQQAQEALAIVAKIKSDEVIPIRGLKGRGM